MATAPPSSAVQDIAAQQLAKVRALKDVMEAASVDEPISAAAVQSAAQRGLSLIEEVEHLQRKKQLTQLSEQVETLRNKASDYDPDLRRTMLSATKAAADILKLIE